MIKLGKQQEDDLLNFLSVDPYINLFLIGDIEIFGFDDAIQTFYGDYNEGELRGVIFRYRNDSMHIYATEVSETLIAKARALYQDEQFVTLMIGEKTMALVDGRLDDLVASDSVMMMSVYQPNDLSVDVSDVIELGVEHTDEMVTLLKEAFPNNNSNQKEQIIENMNQKTSTYYGVVDKRVVSIASYTAESQYAAMIVGVGTADAYRGRGYATQVVKKLSDDLLAKGKRGVLFYDNPVAARIYERMGYTPYAKLHMMKVKR